MSCLLAHLLLPVSADGVYPRINADANARIAPVKRPVKPSKPQALAGKKPPKFALEGNKWLIVSCVRS